MIATIRYADVYSTFFDGTLAQSPLIKAFDALVTKPHGALSLKLVRIGRLLRERAQDAQEAVRLNAVAHGIDKLEKGQKPSPDYLTAFDTIMMTSFEVEAIRYSEIPEPEKLEPWILIDLGALLDFDAPGPEAAGVESAK